jgi:glycosyltransferase involved in cell wall biosynthesis
MLVSVIIPAYNAEKWVSETIASVLRQTHRHLEIILVDDGSVDNTAEVAAKSLHLCPFPFQIVRQANTGAAGARNRGREAAKGEWIQFLDADDLLESSKIETQVARVEEEARADVVYSDWRKLVHDGKAWKGGDLKTPLIGPNALADVLSDRNFMQLSCMIIRSSILDAVDGFDGSHEPIEDVGLYVKIAMADGVFVKAQSNGPVASYRDLPRSLSKINHRRFIESCIKNAKLAEQHLDLSGRRDPITVDAIVDVYCAGTRFFAGLDWERFEEIYADIRALRPNFVPKTPRQLNLLSRIAGYGTAERFAVVYRRSKSLGASLWRNGAPR